MKTMFKILNALLCAGSLSVAGLVHADETFTQGGQTYVLKSDVVGVIRKQKSELAMSPEERAAAKKQTTFFDIYDSTHAGRGVKDVTGKTKYKVVYKQVTNATTHEVKEVPALLTGNVIVQTNNPAALKTSLKLKKSFQNNGFYIYELPDNQAIAQTLADLSKQTGVRAQIEVVEHLRVPM